MSATKSSKKQAFMLMCPTCLGTDISVSFCNNVHAPKMICLECGERDDQGNFVTEAEIEITQEEVKITVKT